MLTTLYNAYTVNKAIQSAATQSFLQGYDLGYAIGDQHGYADALAERTTNESVHNPQTPR